MPVGSRLLRSTALGCLGILGLSEPVRAASVTWTAPEACPAEALIIERLEASRGGPLRDDPPLDFVAEVHEPAPGRFTLTVRTQRGPQGRTLTANDCEELAAALGQIVSLALGPHLPVVSPAREEPAPEPTTQSELPPEPSSTAVAATFSLFEERKEAEREPALRRREPERTRALIGLLGVFDGATLGPASIGVQVEAGLRLSSWFELRTVLGYVPPRTIESELAGTDASGRLSLALGGIIGCAVWRASPWRTPFCGGVEGGRLSASGGGVAEPETEHLLWLAARADTRLGVELSSSLRANLLAGLVFPLLRHEFSVLDAPLHRLPALSARAGLGLEYAF